MTGRVYQSSSYLNAKSTTGMRTRVEDASSTSGMRPICIRDCPFLCEIGLSRFRGRESLYPVSDRFGESTTVSLRDFGLDWPQFDILSDLMGAKATGIPLPEEAESDVFEKILS
jgi:hypothetical protein